MPGASGLEKSKRKRRHQASGRPARTGTGIAWTRLSAEIRSCQLCPLGRLRTNAVVYRGALTPRVVFIGEAPGVEEDRSGIPFVGRAGRELDAAIATLRLSETEVGVLNVLKCRPPGNRFDRNAARTCRPYLDRQLELLRPEVVVTLGAHALRALDAEAPPMLSASGREVTRGAIPHFALLHPAAALRSRRLRTRWDHDVRALGRWLARRAA